MARASGTLISVTGGEGPLERVLRQQSLYPVYQPIVNLADASVYAHEALIRGPQGTPLHTPDALLRAAAQEDLACEFEFACVVEAMQTWGCINAPGRLFVNISANALTQLLRERGTQDLLRWLHSVRVLSRMVDAVMIRANRHDDVERFAQASTAPVINGLTDKSHPCQILADLLTIEERSGPVAGKSFAWVGDGNNVCASLIHASGRLGFRLNIACPAAYHPDLMDLARSGGGQVQVSHDAARAVIGVDAVFTDTWVSMGDTDHEERLAAFDAFRVDDDLMSLAAPGALFLHCLPAHRGEEVTDSVIDGPSSVVFEEAENRIHAQKAVLAWCFGVI